MIENNSTTGCAMRKSALRNNTSHRNSVNQNVNLQHIRRHRMSMPVIPSFWAPKKDSPKKFRSRKMSVASLNVNVTAEDSQSSYYVAADGIDDDIIESVETEEFDDIGSSSDSGVDNAFNVVHCMPVPTQQVCEIQKCISHTGGVISIPESDISLHVSSFYQQDMMKSHMIGTLASTDTKTSSPAKLVKKYYNHKTLDINEPQHGKFDGRIVISQEDAPNCLNKPNQIVAGPMVRVDYAQSRLLKNGAVLQLNLTTAMNLERKDLLAGEIKTRSACLISNSATGPFIEIKSSCCCYYGNTAQVTLHPDSFQHLTAKEEKKTFFVVPVIKSDPTLSNANWSKFTSHVVRVGVYGYEYLNDVTKCCLSISRTNVMQPIMRVDNGKEKSTILHLWSSFVIRLESFQDINIFVDATNFDVCSPSSGIFHSPLCLSISSNDMQKFSKINKHFTIKRKGAIHSKPGFEALSTCKNFDSDLPPRQKSQINITMNAMGDGSVFKLQTTSPSYPPTLRASSPIRRWQKLYARPKTLICKRPQANEHGLVFAWESSVDKTCKLKTLATIPGADRRLHAIEYVSAINNKSRTKRHNNEELFIEHKNGDLIPVVSKSTIQMLPPGSNKFREWHIGFQHGGIGLINTRATKLCKKIVPLTDKLTVGHVVESLTEIMLGGKYDYDYANVSLLLIDNLKDWNQFSDILGFRETFVYDVMENASHRAAIKTTQLLSLFLAKLKDYCDNSCKSMAFLPQITRALFFMEEYSIIELILYDTCIKTLSNYIGHNWEEFKRATVSHQEAASESLQNPHTSAPSHTSCTQGGHGNSAPESTLNTPFKIVQYWKSNLSNKTTKLTKLLHIVNNLKDFPENVLKDLTKLLTIISSIDVLKQYCTRL